MVLGRRLSDLQEADLPKTRLGKWSVGIAVACLLISTAWQIGLAVERHRNAVWERLHPVPYMRPPLPTVFNWNLLSYIAIILCVCTSVVGVISSARERSIVVWVITLTGVLILLLMLGNLFFPHQTPF